jgi:isocitrate lyase
MRSARRRDRVAEGNGSEVDWLAPIVADAEAGFGGPLNAFELMKAMIDAGAAGVHFEDQLARRRSAATSAGRCSCRPRSSCER